MYTNRSHTIAAACVVLVALGVNDASVASAQQSGSVSAPVRCQWTVAELPRTPDAVEGWYRGCPRSDVLRSPTGVEGWTR